MADLELVGDDGMRRLRAAATRRRQPWRLLQPVLRAGVLGRRLEIVVGVLVLLVRVGRGSAVGGLFAKGVEVAVDAVRRHPCAEI